MGGDGHEGRRRRIAMTNPSVESAATVIVGSGTAVNSMNTFWPSLVMLNEPCVVRSSRAPVESANVVPLIV